MLTSLKKMIRTKASQHELEATPANLDTPSRSHVAPQAPHDKPHFEQRSPFVDTASPEDIHYCFRLILGRNPNREEWAGHSSRAGEQLSVVVASYLNSLEFANRNLLQLPTDERPDQVTIDGIQIYASSLDKDVGQHVLAGTYEPHVTAVFRRTLKPGMTVLDIGANIGYFSLLSASLVGPSGAVYAVEPNSDNVKQLEASRRANGFENISILQVGASDHDGLLVLNSSFSNGTTAQLSDSLDTLLRSTTVPCFTLDKLLLQDVQRFDFIKIDIEGAEYRALTGATKLIQRDKPIIVSEFSPDIMPGISGVQGIDYLQWLVAQGYSLSVLHTNGTIENCAHDCERVMGAYTASGVDHIDILALSTAQ